MSTVMVTSTVSSRARCALAQVSAMLPNRPTGVGIASNPDQDTVRVQEVIVTVAIEVFIAEVQQSSCSPLMSHLYSMLASGAGEKTTS